MQTDGGGSLGLVQAALLVVVAFVCLFVLLRDTTWSTWLWSLWGGSRTGSSSSSSSAKEEAHNNVSKKKETTTADDASSSDGEEKDEPEKDEPEGVSAAAALDSGMTGSSLQPTFVDPSRQGMISGAAARSSSSSAPSPVAPFPVARPPAPGLWTPAAASLFAGSATGAGTSRQIGLTHSGHAAAVAAASVADDGVSAFSRFQPTAYAH